MPHQWTTNVMGSRLGILLIVLLSAAGAAGAQPPSVQAGGQQAPPPAAAIPLEPSSTAASADARPATTTFLGDSGVWFVPIAEVLPDRTWSVTGYRRGTNYIQGSTSVADFAGTFAVGVANRIELFGSVLGATTVDRDLQPVFVANPSYGGFVDRYPRVLSSSPVTGFGDSYLGLKVNLMSESRGHLVAAAVRTVVKLPTADELSGTGRTDVSLEAIGSKEFAERFEVAALLGYRFQGQPSGFVTPSGAITWGAATSFPSRGAFRVFGEATGEVVSSDFASRMVPLVGTDDSIPPVSVDTENLMRLTVGLNWQMRGGLFIGAGVTWTPPRAERIPATQTDHAFGDFRDWQIRIGFHPGIHLFAKPQSTRG